MDPLAVEALVLLFIERASGDSGPGALASFSFLPPFGDEMEDDDNDPEDEDVDESLSEFSSLSSSITCMLDALDFFILLDFTATRLPILTPILAQNLRG